MKHLKLFEDNINDVNKDEYLFLFHWDDGYSIHNEGYIQRNRDRYLSDDISDSDGLQIAKKILDLNVDESFGNHNKYGEQILNGYLHSIQKIRCEFDPTDPEFDIKIESDKYNI